MNARATAIRRSTRVALRFEPVDGDYRYAEYWDGNGNGVGSAEIASGLDPEIARPESLGSPFPGVTFGLHVGIADVDGERSNTTDGVRVGSSRILTLGPDGTASSGTLYVRGRRGQFAVRVSGSPDERECCAFTREPANGRCRE